MSDRDYCPDCGRLVAFSWPVGQAAPEETICNPLSSPGCWTQPNLQLVHRPSARVTLRPPELLEALSAG